MADTAVHRVFAIAELTRLVLDYVESGKDLFNVKKTCHTLNDHVNAMLQELIAGSDTAKKLTNGEAAINPFLDLCYTRFPCDAENEHYFVFRFTDNAALASDLPFKLFATQPPRPELRLFIYHVRKPQLRSRDYIYDYLHRPMLSAGMSWGYVTQNIRGMTGDRSYKDHRVLENKTGVTLGDVVKRLGPWTDAVDKLVMIVPDVGSNACDEAMKVFDAAIKKHKDATPRPGVPSARAT